jgi:preprotein translocase subunit SecG
MRDGAGQQRAMQFLTRAETSTWILSTMDPKRLLRAIGCFIVALLFLVQPTCGGGHSLSVRHNVVQGTRSDEDERAAQAMRVLGGVFLVVAVVLAFGKSDLP